MTYAESVAYLLSQLPMFQRIGSAAYRADLKNIRALCEKLGNPQEELRFIHVAGTNGKGSVTHIIASVLQAQGYKTGIFSSPHYTDFRERIKVNGELIHEDFVADFVTHQVQHLTDIQPSFFEMTTAMAFAYFKEKQVDFVVLETGMGGRLDSTNIVRPILSVITNISLDHQAFLGNTLEAIAGEKAGIIKSGIPVIIGETHPLTRDLFKRVARSQHADIFFADQVYRVVPLKDKKIYRQIELHRMHQRMGAYLTDLLADYQLKNIATAAMSVEMLKSLGVSISAVAFRQGLHFVGKNTHFFGRWMIRNLHPLVIVDSAHNEEGIRLALQNITKYVCKRLHIVYGCVNDKDMQPVWSLLPKNALYYFCQANIPRAMNALTLRDQLQSYDLQGAVYPSVRQAYEAACKVAVKSDVVLVIGSVFIASETL